MEYINQILQSLIDTFDFGYCAVVNIATYLLIKVLNEIIPLSRWYKRLVLVVVILSTGGVYVIFGGDIKLIINSAILAPVSWSWIFKPILSKFKLDYNNQDVEF